MLMHAQQMNIFRALRLLKEKQSKKQFYTNKE